MLSIFACSITIWYFGIFDLDPVHNPPGNNRYGGVETDQKRPERRGEEEEEEES